MYPTDPRGGELVGIYVLEKGRLRYFSSCHSLSDAIYVAESVRSFFRRPAFVADMDYPFDGLRACQERCRPRVNR